MEKNNDFIIKVPNVSSKISNNSKSEKQKNYNVDELRKSIKSQYDELLSFQDTEITKENINDIENLIYAAEDLIQNCMNDEIYSGNRDQYFVNLIFICHKLSLNVQSYKIEMKIIDLSNKSNNIKKNQEKLQKQQEKSEEQANNLVYNILGFIASFSIISASVAAIIKIKSLSSIMIFMAFSILLLLTTLIGLHNFYKINNKPKRLIQNNYFLWIMTGIVILLLLSYKGVEYIKENKEIVFENIGKGIGQVMQEKNE